MQYLLSASHLIFRLIAIIPLTLIAITSILWGCLFLFLGLLLIISSLSKIYANHRTIVLFLGFLICLVTLPFTFNQISNRMDTLGKTIREDGSHKLTYSQKVSIYLGHIIMGRAGYLIWAPEVANETLLLMKPHKKNHEYSVQNSFAMNSPLVSGIVKAFITDVVNMKSDLTLKRVPLRWSKTTVHSMKDYRVSLAVAGGGLRAQARRIQDGYKIDYKITIHVKYSKNYKLNILNTYGVRLYVDEAIFSALQDIGWLHPYIIHYTWSVETDNVGKIKSLD